MRVVNRHQRQSGSLNAQCRMTLAMLMPLRPKEGSASELDKISKLTAD